MPKISELTEDASPSFDDLIVAVNDPGGSPATKKITLANLFNIMGHRHEVRTMIGNEALSYVDVTDKRYLLNPGGADRVITPGSGYSAGVSILIVNTGNYLITFDPSGLNQAVGPGQSTTFYFDGTNWRI